MILLTALIPSSSLSNEPRFEPLVIILPFSSYSFVSIAQSISSISNICVRPDSDAKFCFIESIISGIKFGTDVSMSVIVISYSLAIATFRKND